METECLLDGDSESEGLALACVSVTTGSTSLATSGWFCSERTRVIVSGKAVPLRKNSIRVLSIKASPALLRTRGTDAFFINDDDADEYDDASVFSGTDPLVMPLRAINMLKIRRHSSAVVACVRSRCMSFASVSVKKGTEGGSIAGTTLRDIDRAGESGGVCCGSERTSFVDCPFLAFPFPFT